jgi:hypothetical protein
MRKGFIEPFLQEMKFVSKNSDKGGNHEFIVIIAEKDSGSSHMSNYGIIHCVIAVSTHTFTGVFYY